MSRIDPQRYREYLAQGPESMRVSDSKIYQELRELLKVTLDERDAAREQRDTLRRSLERYHLLLMNIDGLLESQPATGAYNAWMLELQKAMTQAGHALREPSV